MRLSRVFCLEPAPGSRTVLREIPHTDRTARHLRARVLRAAFPARSPLLPARMRSLRAASVFPASAPQRAEWLRSGTLRLCSVSKKGSRRRVVQASGGTRNPPSTPERPVPRFPPDPPPDLPANDTPHRAYDRGKMHAPQTRRPDDRESAQVAGPRSARPRAGAASLTPPRAARRCPCPCPTQTARLFTSAETPRCPASRPAPRHAEGALSDTRTPPAGNRPGHPRARGQAVRSA